MNRANHKFYRQLLLSLRAQLRGDVDFLLDVALELAANYSLPKPRGTCRTCRATWRTSLAGSMRDFIQRLIDRKQAILYHVENALERLEDGSYGVCRRCDAPISDKRLVSAPYTPLCGPCHSHQSAA